MSDVRFKAFTLIELIVVIAIIGVLAVILVPSMIGYVTKSRLATANANAKLAYENTATYCTECELEGHPVTQLTEQVDLRNCTPGAPYDKDGQHLVEAIQSLMGMANNRGGVAIVSTEGTGIAKEAKWAATEHTRAIGHYPGEYTEEQATTIW